MLPPQTLNPAVASLWAGQAAGCNGCPSGTMLLKETTRELRINAGLSKVVGEQKLCAPEKRSEKA